jgi:hypothetical protein
MRTVVLDDELAELLEQDRPLDQAAREALVMDLLREEWKEDLAALEAWRQQWS